MQLRETFYSCSSETHGARQRGPLDRHFRRLHFLRATDCVCMSSEPSVKRELQKREGGALFYFILIFNLFIWLCWVLAASRQDLRFSLWHAGSLVAACGI